MLISSQVMNKTILTNQIMKEVVLKCIEVDLEHIGENEFTKPLDVVKFYNNLSCNDVVKIYSEYFKDSEDTDDLHILEVLDEYMSRELNRQHINNIIAKQDLGL